MFTFDPAIQDVTGVQIVSGTRAFQRFMVHRVNLPDAATLKSHPEVKELTGSKSGIAVIDSERKVVQLPPGSSAEVDFWVFGADQIVVTHNNPQIALIQKYPTLESFLAAWKIKRDCERELNVQHGVILANLKTHGGEERFIARCVELGVPAAEIVLLDQEIPATDRLMRERKYGETAPVALRVSRLEGMESVLFALQQSEVFARPASIFYDPVGQETDEVVWPFDPAMVAKMYAICPQIEFVLCCPSRWGKREEIEALGRRLQLAGLKPPMIMTDIDLIGRWSEQLAQWSEAPRVANS
jgi:hypothetical protein